MKKIIKFDDEAYDIVITQDLLGKYWATPEGFTLPGTVRSMAADSVDEVVHLMASTIVELRKQDLLEKQAA